MNGQEELQPCVFDEDQLQIILELKGMGKFDEFIDLLRGRINGVAIRSCGQPDDRMAHWDQGRVHELIEIVRACDKATEYKRAFQQQRQAPKTGGALMS